MNTITITQYADLLTVINEPIYITSSLLHIAQETDINMWTLSLGDSFLEIIDQKLLEDFMIKLLTKRKSQLIQIKPALNAIFYMWFDQQASQLRFNLISSAARKLPFGCKINRLSSYHSILQNFIATNKQSNQLTYFDSDDNWDDDDNTEYILDVYVVTI